MAINLIVILCKRLNKETEDAAVDLGSHFLGHDLKGLPLFQCISSGGFAIFSVRADLQSARIDYKHL